MYSTTEGRMRIVDPTLPRCGTDLIDTERRVPNVDPPATARWY